jgi:cytosine/adenosine deaminase-related metal-dependent hydrolase
LVARLRGGPEALTARQALRLATFGGAQVLGRATELGSLEVGTLADIALWKLDGLGGIDVADPVCALVFGSHHPLKLLLINGNPVVENDELQTADADALARRSGTAARRLAGLAGY